MNCANHPDRERTAFCQNCGKPLCAECKRTVDTAVFCEPCLAARLASTPPETPYGYVNVAPYGGPAGAPQGPSVPNPVLAGFLGFIPGVGAMYNGQYAKGVVHLLVFAVLDSISHGYNRLGILVAGWVFYQVFEAYQTARARRDGTPLPNPFGLNDVGERLGFGKAAEHPAPYVPVPPGAPAPAEAPMDPLQSQPTPTQSYPPPPSTGWNAPYTAATFTPVPPGAVPPYGDPFGGVPPAGPFVAGPSRFPVGAAFLIGLGLFFFFMTSGWFPHFPIQRVIPFLLIATGIWIFFRKMTQNGQSLTDDGTPAFRLRLFRAARGAVWVILVGVLFFLDTFYILSWAHSWPLFIIVAGVMVLLERAVFSGSVGTPYAYASAPAPAVEPIVSQRDQEGR